MGDSKKKINETHLGFIQNVTDRMGQNSFHSKNWCVTVISAMVAFYLTQDAATMRPVIAVTACVVTILFSLIDAYYLHLERGYRYLYKVAAQLVEDSTVKDFSMSRPKRYKGFKKYIEALFSVSTGLFYLVILIGIIILYVMTSI